MQRFIDNIIVVLWALIGYPIVAAWMWWTTRSAPA